MNKLFLLYIFFSICLSDIHKYDIDLYGINVAECIVEINDTVINNNKAVKLGYSVQSKNMMKWIYNVNNRYTTIIDENNYQLLYYNKKSTQPKINNTISTNIKKGKIFYKGTSLEINKNEYNIFSLLYALASNLDMVQYDKFIIDREGKKYSGEITLINNNTYELELNELNTNNNGVIKHTDIFSWALFLPNTNKIIEFDQNREIITFCSFKKNFLKFSAKIRE